MMACLANVDIFDSLCTQMCQCVANILISFALSRWCQLRWTWTWHCVARDTGYYEYSAKTTEKCVTPALASPSSNAIADASRNDNTRNRQNNFFFGRGCCYSTFLVMLWLFIYVTVIGSCLICSLDFFSHSACHFHMSVSVEGWSCDLSFHPAAAMAAAVAVAELWVPFLNSVRFFAALLQSSRVPSVTYA